MKQIPNLPALAGRTKEELLEILLREEYGYLPKRPYSVTGTVVKTDEPFCAGKASLTTVTLKCCAEWGEYSFPVYYICPNGKKDLPCFIHINFRDAIPDRHQPTEEITDHGYAILTVCYKDITSDNGDFTNGLAGAVYPDGARENTDCGKIGLWAWGIMAVMDYAMTLPELDHEKISVVGHSRLGKTALLAGALDERFYCAFSNDSGCSGAALSRRNTGETVKRITEVFPYWFCENYKKYADNEEALPFDQHWLIAANIPHKVYAASAEEDSWACPENEYLSCLAASEYYGANGLRGLPTSDRMPEADSCLHGYDVGYHIRRGRHYLSRTDWLNYIEYLGF